MLKLLRYLQKRDYLFICTSIALVLVQVYLELKIPDYMQEITLLVQTPGNEMKDVLIAGGWMLVCAFASLIIAIIVGYIGAYVAASFSKKIRYLLYHKYI